MDVAASGICLRGRKDRGESKMTDKKLAEYQSNMDMAGQLAKVHDCIYYVYDMEGTFQVTPTLDPNKVMAGRVYPGGRKEAHALMSPKGSILR